MEEHSPDVRHPELYALALVLVVAATKMLRVKGRIRLVAEPEIKEKKIIQFSRRMRIDGLEKFGERTVFSAVHFYRDKAHMDQHNAVGTMIVYLPVAYISRLLHMLDYPRIDEDDEPAVLDGCGTIANLIAGYFVKEMTGMGYIHLEMSPFESYINTAVNGIEFSSDQDYKYEIDLEIRGEKKLVMELTMAPVPHY